MTWRVPVATQEPVQTRAAYSTTRTVNINGPGDAGASDYSLRVTCPSGHRYRIVSVVWRNDWNADTDQYMSCGIWTNQPARNQVWRHYFAPFVAAARYTGAGIIGGADSTMTFSDGAQPYSETTIALPDMILEDDWYFEITANNVGAVSNYNMYVTYEDLVL